MNGTQTDWTQWRLGIVGLLMLVGFFKLASSLYEIQITKEKEYLGEQNVTSYRRVRLPAPRGRILDRHGNVLAGNRARYCVAFYLEELRAPGRWSNTVNRVKGQIDRVANIIGRENNVSEKEIWTHLFRRRLLPLLTFYDLSDAAKARFSEFPQPELLPGSEIHVQQDRVYPYGDTACHIIGYVGKGNPKENEDAGNKDISENIPEGLDEEGAPNFNFYMPDLTGRDGIEKAFDSVLAGSSGAELVQIDAVGYKRERITARQQIPGKDVTLTLDIHLQQLCEKALAGHRGAAVLLDVRNGDILSLASAPRYELNRFVPVLEPAYWKEINSDPERPLIHRAASGAYPPGSVVKPLVALTCINEGDIPENYSVWCDGALMIGNHRIRCASRWGHENIEVSRALAVSCNPFFMNEALKVGWEPTLYNAYKKAGFGTAPKIGISTRSALLPNRDWKERRFGRRERWRAGDTAYVSIGQGFLTATPLQIALEAMLLANDGEIVAPRLIRDLGTGTPETNRVVTGSMGWSPRSIQLVRQGMIDAIATDYGTGRRARIPGLTYAGKTGTAEYIKDGMRKKHAWVIGYAPAYDPQYAFAVLCENSDSGGHSAAAVLRTILMSIYHPGKEIPPLAEELAAAPAAEAEDAAGTEDEENVPTFNPDEDESADEAAPAEPQTSENTGGEL